MVDVGVGLVSRFGAKTLSLTSVARHAGVARATAYRMFGGREALVTAIVEREVSLLRGEVEAIDTPSASGRGQRIARCPDCRVAVWSHYASAQEAIHFIRVGTLDNPDAFPPDIHIFTSSKQPWLNLQDGAPVVPEYYDWREYWPAASVERYRRALGK